MSNTQHGFLPHLSTSTALTTLTDKLYDDMDNKHISLLTLCDLSKAFDSVNHKTLLHKLSKVNIDIYWFKDYICNRTQTVRLQNHLSTNTDLHYGVPQGSILGPILLTLYVNDMHEHFDGCTIAMTHRGTTSTHPSL